MDKEMIEEWFEHPITELYFSAVQRHLEEHIEDSKNPYVPGDPFKTFGLCAEYKGIIETLEWIINMKETGEIDEPVGDFPNE